LPRLFSTKYRYYNYYYNLKMQLIPHLGFVAAAVLAVVAEEALGAAMPATSHTLDKSDLVHAHEALEADLSTRGAIKEINIGNL
jgi:NADH:ubiquinone oxidoreductase subunit 4 (subunit M)